MSYLREAVISYVNSQVHKSWYTKHYNVAYGNTKDGVSMNIIHRRGQEFLWGARFSSTSWRLL